MFNEVSTAPMATRISGTEAADTLIGGLGVDAINGNGGNDSLSLNTDAAGAEAEDSGATRQDPPHDDMESSGVVVKHEQDYQFGGTGVVKMSENHVSKTH